MSTSSQIEFALDKQTALYKQHQENRYCDLIIKVEDQQFFVHTCIIAAACPKLHHVIENNKIVVTDDSGGAMYESNLNKEIFSVEMFEHLLSYIYCGSLDWDTLTSELMHKILIAAQWCGFRRLIEDYTCGKHIAYNNSLDGMKDPDKNNIESDITDNDSDENQYVLSCPVCGKDFDQKAKLDRHMKRHADANSSAEEKLGRSRRKASLRVKMAYSSLIPSQKIKSENLDDDMFIDSTNMPSTTTDHVTLKKDTIKIESEEQFKCPVCYKILSTQKTFDEHVSRHVPPKKKTCKKRNVTLLDEDVSAQMHQSHDNEIDVIIPRRTAKGLTVITRASERRRRETATKIRKRKRTKFWMCPDCPNLVFETKRAQVVHKRTSHSAKRRRTNTCKSLLPCDVCGKNFRTKLRLEIHMRVHTGERPYKCPTCCQGFTEKRTMLEHTRRHTGDRPLLCTLCGKSFRFRQSLDRHMKYHLGDRPHGPCHICDKYFVTRQNLTDHIARHSKTYLVRCRSCMVQFPDKAHVIEHRKTCRVKSVKMALRAQCPCLLVFENEEALREHQIICQVRRYDENEAASAVQEILEITAETGDNTTTGPCITEGESASQTNLHGVIADVWNTKMAL